MTGLLHPVQIKCRGCHQWNTQNSKSVCLIFFLLPFLSSFYLTKVEEVKCFGLWHTITMVLSGFPLVVTRLSEYIIFLICFSLTPAVLCAGLAGCSLCSQVCCPDTTPFLGKRIIVTLTWVICVQMHESVDRTLGNPRADEPAGRWGFEWWRILGKRKGKHPC